MRFVTVRHPEAGTATVPVSALAHYADRGWTQVDDAPAPGSAAPPEPAAAEPDDTPPPGKPAARSSRSNS